MPQTQHKPPSTLHIHRHLGCPHTGFPGPPSICTHMYMSLLAAPTPQPGAGVAAAALSPSPLAQHTPQGPYTSVLLALGLEVGTELEGVPGPRPGSHRRLGPPYHIFSRSIRYFSSRTLFFTD